MSSDGHVLPCEISTLPYEITSDDDVLPCEISTLPYEISPADGILPLKSHHYPMKSDRMMELMIKIDRSRRGLSGIVALVSWDH